MRSIFQDSRRRGHVLGAAVILFASSAFAPPQLEAQQNPPSATSTAGMTARQLKILLNGLPECSSLLDEPVRQGADAPYMPLMRAEGVARAYFVVRGVVGPASILTRVYFSRLDGPDSIIRDPAWLERIVASGLQASLDLEARARVRNFSLPFVDARPTFEFFSQPFVRPSTGADLALGIVSSVGAAASLAINTGDAMALRASIQAKREDKQPLTSDLGRAIATPYDNADVIRVLIAAGADPNAPVDDSPSPLMALLAGIPGYSACNIQPLIDGGARLDIRTSLGQSALDLARQGGNPVAVRAIEAALARKTGH